MSREQAIWNWSREERQRIKIHTGLFTLRLPLMTLQAFLFPSQNRAELSCYKKIFKYLNRIWGSERRCSTQWMNERASSFSSICANLFLITFKSSQMSIDLNAKRFKAPRIVMSEASQIFKLFASSQGQCREMDPAHRWWKPSINIFTLKFNLIRDNQLKSFEVNTCELTVVGKCCKIIISLAVDWNDFLLIPAVNKKPIAKN